MNKIIILILVIFATNSSNSQTINYKVGDELNVFTIGGLKLRESPNANSKSIATMKIGDKVTVKNIFDKDSKYFQDVDGFSGYWVQVKYNNIEGFAFDGFLSKLPVPKETLMKDIPKSRFKKDPANELNYEGAEINVALHEYIKQEFQKICEPITYSSFGVDDKTIGADEEHRGVTVQKLNNNVVLIDIGGWEAGSAELQMKEIRLSEVKNLLIILSQRSGVDNKIIEKIRTNLKKIREKYEPIPPILELEMNSIRLKYYPLHGAVWSIYLESASS